MTEIELLKHTLQKSQQKQSVMQLKLTVSQGLVVAQRELVDGQGDYAIRKKDEGDDLYSQMRD